MSDVVASKLDTDSTVLLMVHNTVLIIKLHIMSHNRNTA